MNPFTETQSFLKKWWPITIPMVVVAILPVLITKQMESALVSFIVIPLVVLLFTVLSLHTRVDDVGVHIRFKPFMFKPKVIKWSEIAKAEVREYSPISEYGGWGYRKGWRRRKIAYNIAGYYGLELTLTDGTMMMVGTQNKEQLISYLQYLKTKYAITAIQ